MTDQQRDHIGATTGDPQSAAETPTSPSSERDTAALQDDQDGSAALADPAIRRDAVSVLPGTGDYTDEGDVEVDPADIHIPLHPHRDSAAPGVGADGA